MSHWEKSKTFALNTETLGVNLTDNPLVSKKRDFWAPAAHVTRNFNKKKCCIVLLLFSAIFVKVMDN